MEAGGDDGEGGGEGGDGGLGVVNEMAWQGRVGGLVLMLMGKMWVTVKLRSLWEIIETAREIWADARELGEPVAVSDSALLK